MAVYLGQNEVILRNGISTTDATAIASDILIGKTAYVNDIKIIGTNFIPVKKDVNFYDYDGTLVAGYTVAEAQTLSALPTAPIHTDLTFQEWNYTLAQVNATTSPLDIGVTYITTDGKTHFHITLTAVSGLAPTLYFNKSDTSELTVDWGDGTTSTFTNSGNFDTGAHTYASAGKYIIKTWISSGSGTYGFGNASSTTTVVGGATGAYKQILTKCFVGANVTTIGSNAFNGCSSMILITTPSNITSIADNAFNGCTSLISITIPTSGASVGVSAFTNCRSLTLITIPSSVTSVGDSAFSFCYSVKKYVFKSTTPASFGTNVFNGLASICRVCVPSASLSAYQTATNWSTYANYMEGY